jgi:PilZ domain-containing protein
VDRGPRLPAPAYPHFWTLLDVRWPWYSCPPLSSESNKRETDRIPILGDLQGEIMVFEPLQIKEISRGGASVETRFALAIDSLHELRLTLGRRSVVLKGRIAHSRISDVDQEIVTYRSGIEFIEVSEAVRAVIAEFLETLKAARGV